MHLNIHMPEWLDRNLHGAPVLVQRPAHEQIIDTPGAAGDRLSADIQVADGGATPPDADRFDGTGIAHGGSTHGLPEDYPYVWSM